MGFNVLKLARRYHVEPRGIVHVGAHLGQEHASYLKWGVRRQVWIEPQPAVFERLEASLPCDDQVVAIRAACGAERGRAVMHRLSGNSGASNSLLPPSDSLAAHLPPVSDAEAGGPLEVDVVPLDDLLAERGIDASLHNVLVMDVQGYELECLRGARRYLRDHVDVVGTEVSIGEVYVGGARMEELDAFLEPEGFVRTDVWLVGIHGDAFYVRGEHLSPWQRLRYRFGGCRMHRGHGVPWKGAEAP